MTSFKEFRKPVGWIKPHKRRMTPRAPGSSPGQALPFGPSGPASPFALLVQREDIGICEQVQRGLASGSYVAGRLNPKRESGVHHFHELLRAAYRGCAD